MQKVFKFFGGVCFFMLSMLILRDFLGMDNSNVTIYSFFAAVFSVIGALVGLVFVFFVVAWLGNR